MYQSAVPGASVIDSLVLAEIGAVLIFLGLAALLATALRFSVVPIFLLTGLAFGEGGLVPLKLSDNFLTLGAQMGAILLLLLLGLEYSATELIDGIKQNKSLGIVDLVLNFLPGVLVGIVLGWGYVGAMALGGITYVSSSGIASQFIRDGKLQKAGSTKKAIGILVVEDLFLAPYLPILSAVVSSIGVITGLVTISAALVLTGAVLLFSARGGHIRHIGLMLGDSSSLLLTVFGSTLLAAGLASYIGFSGVVAAFLVGLLLTGDVAIVARVRLAPLRDLFAAIFFLFFGLRTDPAQIPPVLIISLLLAAIGIFTKYLTAKWAARGSNDSVMAIAALIIPRGEFSIVIAGLTSTLAFNNKLQAITITYVLATTIFGSILIRKLEKIPMHGQFIRDY